MGGAGGAEAAGFDGLDDEWLEGAEETEADGTLADEQD